MFNFFKTILSLRKEKVTFILWEDNMPDEPRTFTFIPKHLIRLVLVLFFIVLVLLFLLFRFSPLGSVVFNSNDPEFRENMIVIGERLIALQDSLHIRDEQLENMKEILRLGTDTTFTIGRIRTDIPDFANTSSTAPNSAEYEFLRRPDVQFNVSGYAAQVLPAPFPAEGSISREYLPDQGHYGVDIAAMTGDIIRSIADGVVITTEWTMNYGNVVHVQHGKGYISIYKHVSNPNRKPGDFVQKGDILGSVSGTGLISSGPHLHFEIWQNGTPLNPLNYLIK